MKKLWSFRTADDKFSQFIRKRDGKCQRCGSANNLQASHFWSKNHWATRYDPDNCITLCYPCHYGNGKGWEYDLQGEYREYMLKKLGKHYRELEIKAHSFKSRRQAIEEWQNKWHTINNTTKAGKKTLKKTSKTSLQRHSTTLWRLLSKPARNSRNQPRNGKNSKDSKPKAKKSERKMKQKIKTCPFCKQKFRTQNPKKKFCSLYCKMRQNNQEYYKKNKRPVFVCPNCGKKQVLNFNPLKEYKKLKALTCKCGYNQATHT